MSKKEFLQNWRRNQTELQNLLEGEIPALASLSEASDSEGEQMSVKSDNVSGKNLRKNWRKLCMMIMKNGHLHFSQLLTLNG